MRTLITLCCSALLLLAGAAAAAEPAALPPVLKAAAEVTGRQILLGDLFDNAGVHAAEPLAAAPAPGSAMVLNASWLESTAQAHGLDWRAPTPATQIRVVRAAIELGSAEVEAALAKALGLDRPERRVALDGQLRLYAPAGGPPEIGVEHLSFDQETQRVSAEIRIPANDPAAVPLRVAGRVDTMVALPVLTRARNPGDLIQAGDLTTIWLRSEIVPANAVADARELVGKTPSRPLRANLPMRGTDVMVPVVIKRNELVLIVLEQPGMYLTAEGKALDDGGIGSVIRVTNVQSARTIDAVVLGSGRVAVRLPGTQLAAY